LKNKKNNEQFTKKNNTLIKMHKSKNENVFDEVDLLKQFIMRRVIKT
jgi:hypothetical protein